MHCVNCVDFKNLLLLLFFKYFCLITHTQLSERALRDYNRGRAYLASIANKSHVPTFTNIADATLCAVYKVKGYRVPPASSLPLSGTSV